MAPLARAILANPEILILDDATSALDALTEEAVHRGLSELMAQRTTVIIAHRQSTLRLATRVLVLDGGRIAAQGTNAELLRSSPLYRQLLAGPELEPELTPVDDAKEEEEGQSVDPVAWPAHAARTGIARSASVASELGLASVSSVGAGAGGGGQRDLGGGRAAFVSESPELRRRVAELPPLSGEPDVDVAALTSAGAGFSLRGLLGMFRGSLLLGLALVLVDALTSLSGPYLLGCGVDQVLKTRSGSQLLAVAGVFLGVQLLSWLNSSAMQLQTARTAERLLFCAARPHLRAPAVDLARLLRSRAGRQDHDAHDHRHRGLRAALAAGVADGHRQGADLRRRVRGAVHAGRAAGALGAVDLALAAGGHAAVSAPLGAGLPAGARARVGRQRQPAGELGGYPGHAGLATGGGQPGRFSQLSASYRDARLRSMQLLALYFPQLQVLSVLGKAIVLGIGAGRVAKGELSAGC